MSAVDEEAADGTMLRCASCGTAAGGNINLKICTACKLVRYCSVECQKNHRRQHKKACKKRAAEIREDCLFQQPEISHHGDWREKIFLLENDSKSSEATINFMNC